MKNEVLIRYRIFKLYFRFYILRRERNMSECDIDFLDKMCINPRYRNICQQKINYNRKRLGL